ncbi:MAG TPA: tetratricopeptide repeat protein, partial [Gemmatimonadales bacterium]|nr:tetratricopeptide repeat protein [Gemmatimonadales bacterium]
VPAILQGGRIRLGRALAIWAVAAALVSVTAWAARDAIGLPDWVLPGAVGVMLAGLPVLLATAWVQRVTHRAFTATPHRTPAPQGTMATLAIKASPHLSWRRTWLGGAIAVGSFALLVVAFMVMRAMGIGPMASLQGKGTFGANETLMIADFRSPPSDSTLGVTLAEALRADLAQSSSLDILTRSEIREAMLLMQRPAEESVLYEVAREIATREGAKAVLDGGISQVGQRYMITARLVSVLDGTDLAVFRQEASDENDILPALGRLAREVRTRAGESLKSIRASSELERVTTPSLIALRKYVEGSRLADEAGEPERGIAMLREAVAIDTAFAMAWRKLAVLINNEGRDFDGMQQAITTAYRHRDRLTEMERLLTEGFYYTRGPQRDNAKALAAYEAAARLDSLSTSALNNSAVIFGEMNQFEKAEEYYRKVVRLPRPFGGGFTNLLIAQIRNGRPAAALDSTVELYRATLPESNDFWEAEWYAAWGKGDMSSADSVAAAVAADPRSLRQGLRSASSLSSLAEIRGQVSDARRWQARHMELLNRAEPSAANRLTSALDTAYYEMMYGDRNAASAIVRRALARIPMSEIPASSRPWGTLTNLGAMMGDAALARQGLEGWERDQASLSGNPVARRANFAAGVAFAGRRWGDVISAVTTAERGFTEQPRFAAMIRGLAYMESGRPDSAIVSFERFLSSRDPFAQTDATFRADVLRRMGELYEARGDRSRAIDYYGQFTAQWADADPELQPKVREIRERINRLRGEGG